LAKKIYYNSRDIEFFLGSYFLARSVDLQCRCVGFTLLPTANKNEKPYCCSQCYVFKFLFKYLYNW